MVFGIGKDAGDYPALLRDAEASFIAEGFEIDLARHGADVVALRASIKSDRLAISAEKILPRNRGRISGRYLVLRRLVPRPIFLASVRRCSA
ncbi:hypothetical protein GCM10009087_10580 [Sphingomonas oligophenolica]